MGIRVGGVAVLGVGVSCQTSHQIEMLAPLIRELIPSRKFIKRVRGPFDSLVCPARSVARMIRDWRFHPADPGELVIDERPYWPEGNCWFWHDEEHLTAKDFVSRQDHFVGNLESLKSLKRVVFVLSNTQSNLAEMAQSVRHPMEFALTDDDIDAVESALAAQFPNGELWVLVSKDRNLLQRRRRDPHVIDYVPDPSEWMGDYDQWAAAFRRMLGPAA